ncbi:cysteinyl-tRNA synthetase [Propionibacteriaceae bacterium ES.041]|uniref:cysteine--tRNA ligase n=1 Tax=Enemella evansiae TaxID=2016499 RepID=UPI000B95F742|nr:cysteine--tRNA ligase [Enemella evansiae]OYO04691.1 cysteine--tRNA ligase [Enemella evansiae]PFG66069.1 cysteinyl-tRNA synthetase [Propionibacteriaceae bacterium ES.041]
MTFHLYDTATRQVREFVPLQPGAVSIYHCGLTVQSAPHVGHIRKEVVFDVLRRWLSHSGYRVSVIANVTDIDDKILNKSAEAGEPWYAWAYRFERELHEAYAALGCIPPTYEPRATGHIPEMVELIGELIESGHAYPATDGSGDVYFDVLSWPRYGELSGMRVDEMEAATDADPRGKRDPRDFALWKGHKESEPETASWPSPWGRGRPGWHIECSAMAGKYLGPEFDIHGGGIDLRFPHHENELAQSAAAGRPFARYWMHNAWVTMAGEKMSKSLGNTALVAEVTRTNDPRAVRYFLLAPHYRSTIEFSPADEETKGSLAEAEKAIERIDSFVHRARAATSAEDPSTGSARSGNGEGGPFWDDFARAMDDDLGTPQAVAALFAAIRRGNQLLTEGDQAELAQVLEQVTRMLDVLGLDPDSTTWQDTDRTEQALEPVVDGLVQALLTQRQEARSRKDWAAADAVRDTLAELGLKITDTPDGSTWSLEPKGA